jgi:hypothetical protein
VNFPVAVWENANDKEISAVLREVEQPQVSRVDDIEVAGNENSFTCAARLFQDRRYHVDY